MKYNSTDKKSNEHTLSHSISIDCFIIKTCNAMKDQCYTYQNSNPTCQKLQTIYEASRQKVL